MKKKIIAIIIGGLFISGVAQADPPNEGVNQKNANEAITVEDLVGMSFNEAMSKHKDIIQRLNVMELDDYDLQQFDVKDLQISDLISEHTWAKELRERQNQKQHLQEKRKDLHKHKHQHHHPEHIQKRLDKIKIQELDIEILENELRIKRLQMQNNMANQVRCYDGFADDNTVGAIENEKLKLVKDLDSNA
jgi:hypothetical protein